MTQRWVGRLMLLLLVLAGCQGKPTGTKSGLDTAKLSMQDRAALGIQKMQGTVERDEADPEKPVVNVSLQGTRVTDQGLEHIKHFPKLQVLNLDATRISDAGLVHLKGMTTLQALYLNG